MSALKKLSSEKDLSVDDLIEQCKAIKLECSKGLAEKMLATKEGAYDTLVDISVDEEKPWEARNEALSALAALLDTNPDPFDQRGFQAIMLGLSCDDAIKNSLELALCVCVRHEQNRQNLVRNNILDHLDKLFENHPIEVARIWQALVQDDDVRVPYGKAHENARGIVEDHQGLQKLCSKIGSTENIHDLALLLSCLSSLTVRNEYCQLVADRGLSELFALLAKPDQSSIVLKEVLVMLKALAGNDNVKKDINVSKKLPLIVSTITAHLVKALYFFLMLFGS